MKAFFSCLLCLFAAYVSWAQDDCPKLRKHLEPKSYQKLLDQANGGKESAALSLARALECADRPEEAARWYEVSANAGNAMAQTNLGVMYFSGKGVEQDDRKAFQWYLRAASAGYAAAQNNLALMFGTGRGTTQCDEQAVRWYSRATEQHYFPAYAPLALLYARGQGVSPDVAKAFQLAEAAAKHGVVNAQVTLAYFYADGIGTAKNWSKALEWNLKAAATGLALAELSVGVLYERGDEAHPPNYVEAVYWFRRAADHGAPQALTHLAMLDHGPPKR